MLVMWMVMTCAVQAQSTLSEIAGEDRLTGEETRLIADLTQRQMPELVEALLAGSRPRAAVLQAHIGRAYGRAGLATKEPGLRKAFCEKGLEWYRRVLDALTEPRRIGDDARRLEAAEWLTEYADLIVRFECGDDLDRYELTSGLDFDRGRLQERLREANQRYDEADELLKVLLVGLRTQEEKYLLLGLAERIERLADERELNASWASVYLGMISSASAPSRETMLTKSLAGFDRVARDTRDAVRKYNALIGAGVALRESGRSNEATTTLDRVIVSTAGTGPMGRARYEKVRTLMVSGQFDAARQEIKLLAAMGKSPDSAGASFYLRLAPLLEAHSYLLQSTARVENSPEMQRLRETALEKFNALAKQGGAWPDIVEVYLTNLAGATTEPSKMSEGELRTAAGRLMAKMKNADAAAMLTELTRRKAATQEDQLNLGVCLFQTEQLQEAATQFERAESALYGEISDRAAEYAYRCRKQLAQGSKNRDVLRALARAAMRLASLHEKSSLAPEAAFVAGVAYQEAGDYVEAVEAFLVVKQDNPKYWWARRGIAECLTVPLDSIICDRMRPNPHRDAAIEWSLLAEGLSVGKPASVDKVPASWLTEARLQSATLFAHDRVGEYQKALEVLHDLPDNLDARVIRLRCHRALGDMAAASTELDGLLKEPDRAKASPAIMGLIADIQRQAVKFNPSSRLADVEKFTAQALPMLERVGAWLGEDRHEYNVIRSVRVSVLRTAGRLTDALDDAEKLVAAEPDNGSRLQTAASLLEQIALAAPSAERSALLDRSEALWARLLEDSTLRGYAPQVYWEARYQWLSHQLRHGRAGDVIKAVEAERAWFPELGGPPWQGRLMELVEKARAGTKGP